MLYEVQAGDRIHGPVGPREPTRLDIGSVEVAARRVRLGSPGNVDCVKLKIGTKLSKMAECLAIGRTKVQQSAVLHGTAYESRACVKPWCFSKCAPVHYLYLTALCAKSASRLLIVSSSEHRQRSINYYSA